MTSFAVVCTTIGDGSFLKHYARALEGADVRMYVIPDRKTPKALYDAVKACWPGTFVNCPDPDTQTRMLERLGAPEGFFPWDTDHRRNVGYLMAYESGADVVISVDDDNLPEPGWLDEHAIVAAPSAKHLTRTDPFGHFFNPFELLDVTPVVARPRGFPYRQSARFGTCVRGDQRSQVAINAGLWLGDPDVDAIARLAFYPHSHSHNGGSVVLGAGTWAPVNSQNTAIRREVIPAYYFFRSGRFGDIYQGYLAQACAKAKGHSVRFGTPVVRHERNDHDLLADLTLELPDIKRLDGWLDWLTALKPQGSTYAELYGWLAAELDRHAHGSRDATDQCMAAEMRGWLKLCERISG